MKKSKTAFGTTALKIYSVFFKSHGPYCFVSLQVSSPVFQFAIYKCMLCFSSLGFLRGARFGLVLRSLKKSTFQILIYKSLWQARQISAAD